MFPVGAAFYAKLRWQRTRGVALGTDRVPTMEDIRDNYAKISDFSDATNPGSCAFLPLSSLFLRLLPPFPGARSP